MAEALVTYLKKRGALVTPSLIQAFRDIPREAFVPDDLQQLAQADIPLPIGSGQTISQPSTVAIMLELLAVKPGETVLDVGSGSGWTTALLAALVGEKGKVIALEPLPELCRKTKENVEQFGFVRAGVVQCLCKSGAAGHAEWAPYDRILVSASARAIPAPLKKELAPGGRLVMPVRENLVCLTKRGKDDFEEEEFPGFTFVPFIEK